jgi:hypothetical protein
LWNYFPLRCFLDGFFGGGADAKACIIPFGGSVQGNFSSVAFLTVSKAICEKSRFSDFFMAANGIKGGKTSHPKITPQNSK